MLRGFASLVLSFSVLLSGCASSTLINSIPPGAKVYVDGQYLGHAPVKQKDAAILGSFKDVVLKKDGYRDQSGTIRKDEIRFLPLIAGIWLIIPWLWVTGYPDQYTFELEEIPSAEGQP